METTETQTISLLERFKNAEEKVSTYHNGAEHRWYPERQSMEYELGRLLGYEIDSSWWLKHDNNAELLNEYKECFEWDSKYSVMVRWEIEPSSLTDCIACSSPEEIKEYLNNQKELDTPSWDEDVSCCIEYGSDFTGEKDLKAEVSVSNLRPKQQEQEKVMVSVLVPKGITEVSFKEYLADMFPSWELVSITAND